MATTVARLEAILSADTRDFDRSIGRSEGRMSSAGRAIGKSALLAGAAVAAGFAVAAKRGFDELRESQEVIAQTNAGIKSTGGIANVTAKSMQNLTGRLSRLSGIDDELIQKGANLLLTFKKVRNEVGKGNDIFDRATTSALDLSVRGFGSMDSTSKMLGKALEDPVKGLTALGKAGVTFSVAQKEVIKDLVASGDILGAQKLIMAEVESQVKGSAEAYGDTLSGQIGKAMNMFDEFAGKMVAAVIPALVSFASVVGPLVLAVLDAIGKLIDTFVAPKVRELAAAAEESWPKIQVIASNVFGWLRDHVFPIIISLRDIWVTAVQRIREVLVNNEPEIKRIFERVGAAMDNLSKVIVPLLKVAFTDVLPVAIGFTVAALDKVSGAMESISSKKGPSLLDIMDRLGLKSEWVKDKLMVGMNAGLIEIINKDKGLLEMLGIWQRIADWINRAWKHLKDFSDKLSDITGPSGLDLLKKVTGDARDPFLTLPSPGGGAGATGLVPGILDELAGARAMGLTLTSGVRHTRTASGAWSDHHYGKAIDVAGAPSAMAGFFRWLIGQRDVKQAFYDPLGSIFGGMLSSYREGGHSDHVHVATYKHGGLVPGFGPQLAVVHGGERITPRNEGNVVIPVSIGGEHIATVVFDMLRRKAQVFERNNQRPAFGGL